MYATLNVILLLMSISTWYFINCKKFNYCKKRKRKIKRKGASVRRSQKSVSKKISKRSTPGTTSSRKSSRKMEDSSSPVSPGDLKRLTNMVKAFMAPRDPRRAELQYAERTPLGKLERIAKGEKRDTSDYATFDDILSDWKTEEGRKIKIEPKKEELDEKQKKIAAGAKRNKDDYPTMGDIMSDWDSKEDAKKKEVEQEQEDREEEKSAADASENDDKEKKDESPIKKESRENAEERESGARISKESVEKKKVKELTTTKVPESVRRDFGILEKRVKKNDDIERGRERKMEDGNEVGTPSAEKGSAEPRKKLLKQAKKVSREKAQEHELIKKESKEIAEAVGKIKNESKERPEVVANIDRESREKAQANEQFEKESKERAEVIEDVKAKEKLSCEKTPMTKIVSKDPMKRSPASVNSRGQVLAKKSPENGMKMGGGQKKSPVEEKGKVSSQQGYSGGKLKKTQSSGSEGQAQEGKEARRDEIKKRDEKEESSKPDCNGKSNAKKIGKPKAIMSKRDSKKKKVSSRNLLAFMIEILGLSEKVRDVEDMTVSCTLVHALLSKVKRTLN
ncbi:hypothetical protein GCK32_006441 [Trichostrongylus colubriformis]|uniref:Uncharacterized protein n=1 Tax=Trichostrongylus colubriformis TaxID=6319 RepID=A0AAN8IN59_TRICO